MAAAFAGWQNLRLAYEEALNNDYQFLSYGDSMFIL
jgi:S-adenosylmethionine:tRNA ribosyltransferase-isomerase